MATMVLAAAGSAFGGGLGGSLFGLGAAALGRAAGATLGSMIDQRILGGGAAAVETGRVDRLRVMGSSEGAPLPRVFGRMRVPGQLVWSSRFVEQVSRERVGGKATGPSQTVKRYGYSISIALALCEGEVTRVGRIWADGQPLPQRNLNWRLHRGSEDQLPDPLIAAIEGADAAPAYRGTAYVVLEDLDLGPFGNRIPQLNFEVFRRPRPARTTGSAPASALVPAVALVPGTGEYSLATEPVTLFRGRGDAVVANVHNDQGLPDLVVSLDQMEAELPSCGAVSLVVSWFADDLRIDRAQLYPAVEQREVDGDEMPWRVGGISRASAPLVGRIEDRPLFGGTPADAAVVQAIRHLKASGKSVMFYPFILLDLIAGNGKPNPWSPSEEQPPVPWRGRMTLSTAPGVEGSPDKTSVAAEEVQSFFGAASPHHIVEQGGVVGYAGPAEWSYRRFILHYARLCAVAGGVDAFCIGSEMRSLTQIRDGIDTYPAVRELVRLATDVRSILGPDVKVSYAADWSEYFGHQPGDGSGDAVFHLDPFWSHPDVDFVGIDNYMPMSDWREGPDHLDVAAGSIYDLDYLRSNVAGGEGYDWFYPDAAAREIQDRRPIEDGAYGEPWVFRYKDLRNWWGNPHENRIGGVKTGTPTGWIGGMKPIWFTELGCPAVDKGTNQPNVFFDPKSSESFLPYHSNGLTDPLIQQRYLQAAFDFWEDPENNSVSSFYAGRMVDLDRAYVWAWDSRPWPDFPMRLETWVDGTNYARGHWLNGRIDGPELADVIAELCERAGLHALDLDNVHAPVTGYIAGGVETARQSLQPLLFAHAIDAHSVERRLAFSSRYRPVAARLGDETMASRSGQPGVELLRASDKELPGRVVYGFLRSDEDYRVGSVESIASDVAEPHAAEISAPLVLSECAAIAIAERWLCETRVSKDTAQFDLPSSKQALQCGDLVELERDGLADRFRIDRIDEGTVRSIRATRVDGAVFMPYPIVSSRPRYEALPAPSAAHVDLLDVPLLRGDEVPHAPRFAAAKKPWRGPIAAFGSWGDASWEPIGLAEFPATVGQLLDPLPAATPGLWMRKSIRLALDTGLLASRSQDAVLRGANTALLHSGSGSECEVVQFLSAEIEAPGVYRVGGWLRGQAGTDACEPETWPVGTSFILVDDALTQIDVPPSAVGTKLAMRFGPASEGLSSHSFRTRELMIRGVGLRPYRVAHLRAKPDGRGGLIVDWIRRTRIGGDSWEGEVPVGEEALNFEVQVRAEGKLLRSVNVSEESYHYSVAERALDRWSGCVEFLVAQLSAVVGPGPFERITIDE